MSFERTIDIDELDDGVPHALTLASGARICLVRAGETVYALVDRCSHAEFPMSEGDVVDPCVIECALHGAQFDLRDGRVLEPPADEPLVMCKVRIDQGTVWVQSPV